MARNFPIFILGIILAKASADCRDGWLKLHGSCYLIALQPSTWAEAEAFCLAADASLVEIETKTESDLLEAHLREVHRGTSTLANSYWIGGNDIQIEGDFRWFKSDSSLAFTDWNPGQPDDAGTNEDCMELQGSFAYHWNDRDCNSKQHFICEAKSLYIEPNTVIG